MSIVVVGYRFGRRHCDGLRRYGSLVVGGSDARPLAFQGCFFWVFNDWRPRWIFRMASLREFFGYSSNLVVSGIINNVFNKIYPIIIGKFYGMTQTGYYTQADKYQDIASSLISNIFRSVAFLFSRRCKTICNG